MKKILTFSSFLFFCLVACNNQDKQQDKSENDLDAARNFIQAALYGKYDEATNYMLRDSINDERMRLMQRVRLSPDEKRGLASASINIHNVHPVNDSTTIIIYSNSFKNDWDTLKIIKLKGKWLVDFNYLFDHDSDTLINKSASKPGNSNVPDRSSDTLNKQPADANNNNKVIDHKIDSLKKRRANKTDNSK